MKQEFFANASHELKTPLTSIQGYAELLDTGTLDGALQKDCIEHILVSTKRMTSLIQDILMISRLESNEQIGQKEVIDLRNLIDTILLSMKPKLEQKNIKVHVKVGNILVHTYRP